MRGFTRESGIVPYGKGRALHNSIGLLARGVEVWVRRAAAWGAAWILGAAGVAIATGPWWPAGAMIARAQEVSKAGKAHPELPDTTAETCLTCHEDVAKGEVVHGPVSAGMCDTCHVFDGKGDDTRVRLGEQAAKDNTLPLCAGCHDEVATAARGERAHGPAGAGDCLSCHAAHASAHRALLKAREPGVCSACHDTAGADLAKAIVHAPARVGCASCHDPHGGTERAHLRTGVNDLCLACHTAATQQSPRTGEPVLFGRPVAPDLVPMLTTAKAVLLDPLRRRGHPVGNHPVRGAKDPAAEDQPLTCVSCHAPHGSALPSLRRFGEDATDFCVKCHK